MRKESIVGHSRIKESSSFWVHMILWSQQLFDTNKLWGNYANHPNVDFARNTERIALCCLLHLLQENLCKLNSTYIWMIVGFTTMEHCSNLQTEIAKVTVCWRTHLRTTWSLWHPPSPQTSPSFPVMLFQGFLRTKLKATTAPGISMISIRWVSLSIVLFIKISGGVRV